MKRRDFLLNDGQTKEKKYIVLVEIGKERKNRWKEQLKNRCESVLLAEFVNQKIALDAYQEKN